MFAPQDRRVIVDRQGTPRLESEYYRLKSRQGELEEQLEDVSDRREELAQQVNQRVGTDREGIEAWIKSLDTQIQALEASLADVGRQVAQAAPAQLSVPQPRTIYRGFGEEDMVMAGFTGAGLMLALCLPFLLRLMRRRRWVPASTVQTPGIAAERIDRMENAIDSIAVEMERVAENQRFMTRLMTETQLAGTIAAVRGSTEAAKAAAEKASHV